MILCLRGSWSFNTDGIGIEKMRISVAILMPEEKYQIGSVSRQVLAILGTIMWIGKHASPRRMACTHAQTQT
jgi:hypothetical protein